ncbi:hypothetical protein WN944_024387 [Citrus x changshan-huyou]|uniref:Uncharacterized protein n=1 Tax=Citrus x changshan-huyou TaxID=2935761 RepID=A0AAP0QCK3_9ROSI
MGSRIGLLLIILTAGDYGQEEDEGKGEKLGCAEYMMKHLLCFELQRFRRSSWFLVYLQDFGILDLGCLLAALGA